jgi:hypothetical protein
MPLAYKGSVLALILAAGSASGVGFVILVPQPHRPASTRRHATYLVRFP